MFKGTLGDPLLTLHSEPYIYDNSIGSISILFRAKYRKICRLHRHFCHKSICLEANKVSKFSKNQSLIFTKKYILKADRHIQKDILKDFFYFGTNKKTAAIVAERSRVSTFVVDSSRAIRVDGPEFESRQGMADKE